MGKPANVEGNKQTDSKKDDGPSTATTGHVGHDIQHSLHHHRRSSYPLTTPIRRRSTVDHDSHSHGHDFVSGHHHYQKRFSKIEQEYDEHGNPISITDSFHPHHHHHHHHHYSHSHPRHSRTVEADILPRFSDSNFQTEDTLKKPSVGKIPLPKPYRSHWEEMQKRRAMKHFIYGKDEDYEFSEKDSRVPTPCSGIICFHIIELLNLVVNRQSFVDNVPVSYYCMLSIGTIKRCTKIVHTWQSRQVKIDSHVHLTIEVSEIRDAANNKLRLELWSFQDPEAHFIVGTCEIHIYNFIRTQHNIDWIPLWSDGIKVGKLAYEVAFSYGVFGYGHSNQLKNFAQPIMETISHSMFPRIRLDEKADIADKAFQVRKPETLKLFTYHSLILEVDEKDPWNIPIFGGRKKNKTAYIDLEPKPIVVQQVDFSAGFPVHCKLHMNIWQKVMQPDFNDMYGEYVCIGHKRERLEYLMNMVQGRLRDMREEDVGPLFEYLKPKDLEEIHKTPFVPGEILYPKKIPCPTSQELQYQTGDEEFQNKFPSVKRESGFLAQMFGYEAKPPPSQFLNDMDYPAFKDAKIVKPKTDFIKYQHRFIDWFQRIWIWIKAKTVLCFYYIFPEVGNDIPVPEISLTVATPEGSTTGIYSYFTREFKDQITNKKLDRIVKHTTAFIDTSKKSQKDADASDSSDSDVDEYKE